jgi:hypothetical protein
MSGESEAFVMCSRSVYVSTTVALQYFVPGVKHVGVIITSAT